MILVILGPQASGKGTQATKLSEKHNLFYYDAGAHLRRLAKKDPKIDEIVNKRGELLPDEDIFEITKKHLEEYKIPNKIIFDGYPRSVKQYEMLVNWLSENNKKIDAVIFLNISDETAIDRLSSRRIHTKTGKVYNLKTNPPPKEIPEDELEQRDDDQPEAIKHRLESYHSTTQPLIKHLKETNPGVVHEVSGEQSIEKVEKNIEKIISKING